MGLLWTSSCSPNLWKILVEGSGHVCIVRTLLSSGVFKDLELHVAPLMRSNNLLRT